MRTLIAMFTLVGVIGLGQSEAERLSLRVARVEHALGDRVGHVVQQLVAPVLAQLTVVDQLRH